MYTWVQSGYRLSDRHTPEQRALVIRLTSILSVPRVNQSNYLPFELNVMLIEQDHSSCLILEDDLNFHFRYRASGTDKLPNVPPEK
jgi:hypothetical protein